MLTAIGIAVVDHVMIVDGFAGHEGTFYTRSYRSEGGGMAATACCAAARLGGQARLMARIGDDLNGRFIRENAEAFGVDVSRVTTVPGAPTPVSIVLVDAVTGEKQFWSERDKTVFHGEIVLDVSAFAGTGVLLVDGNWMEQAYAGVAWAKCNRVPVVADFKRGYAGLEALFPHLDYCILPRFFAHDLTGRRDDAEALHALADLQAGIPVITAGAAGGVYLRDGVVARYRVFPVECVDSTGAGDAFHGAFCRFIEAGMPFEQCLEAASAVGALNCRMYGGRNALPDRGELAAFLVKHGSDIPVP